MNKFEFLMACLYLGAVLLGLSVMAIEGELG
jgi:hypothetical protein